MEIPAPVIVGIAQNLTLERRCFERCHHVLVPFLELLTPSLIFVCPLVVRCPATTEWPETAFVRREMASPQIAKIMGREADLKKEKVPFSLVRPSPVSPLSDSQALSDL
jgi:hypothetical protein